MPPILIFIIVLSLLVFVHEFGHFCAARLLGVKVREFGFGFPPRLWGIRRKETTYSINWIPVGGFVRLHGEDGEEHDAGSFVAASAWRRFVILVAGVLMNVVLAFVVFTIGFASGLPTDVTDGVPAGANVRNVELQIIAVAEGSAASTAKLQPGDAVVSIDGIPTTFPTDVQQRTRNVGNREVRIQYERNGTILEQNILLAPIPGTENTGLGVSLSQIGSVSYGLGRSILEGARATYDSFLAIVQAFAQLIANLVAHGKVSADVAGPVGIAVLTGQVAQLGFAYILQFTALLSLNLALINILPIPALDGGRVLFLAIERLRGKPLHRATEAKIHSAGFAALLALVALITLRDVLRLEAVRTLWDRLF